MNPDTRYIYRKEPLSEKEARDLHAERIRAVRHDIQRRKDQLRELEEDLAALKGPPTIKDRTVQISLNPGDPGYDEAPIEFRASHYLGDFQFINIP